MNYIILCDTPYQILSAISFRLDQASGNDRVDLLVDILRTPNVDMKALAYRINEAPIFTNVYCIENLQNKYEKLKKLTKIFEWVFPNIIYGLMTKEIVRDYEYDVVVVSGPFSTQRCLIAAYPQSDIYFIEDGLGSYIGRNGIRELSWRGKIAQRIFKYSPTHIYPKASFLYAPGFYIGDYEKCIRKLTFPMNHIEIIDDIYSININKIKKLYGSYKFIYFSQLISMNTNEIQLEKDIINVINNYKDDFIVKPHPRGVTALYKELNVDDSYNQWELCCTEISNNSVLVANFSTALFVPKLIFNKEPTVIFLYKMYGNNFVEDTVNRFRNLYSDKNKVICVSSLEELIEKINTLRVI